MSQWQDTISDSFPPPYEREPRSLRADILDELADHLECATRRELLKVRDESQARQAALERFGDPKSIARRLWWDGMKGRIMKDRLFLVLFTFGVIALLAAVVIPWAAKQNAINEAILTKLNSLSTPPAPASRPALPENWVSLKVRVREEGTGRPLEEVGVHLKGKPFTDTDTNELSEYTDAQGLVRFGPIRPGPYQARTVTAFDGDLTLFNYKDVTLYAGQEREFTVTRPKGDIASNLTLHVGGPDYLQKQDCIAIYDLTKPRDVECEGTGWGSNYVRALVIPIAGDTWQDFSGYNIPEGLFDLSREAHPFPLRWAAGNYRIDRIRICRCLDGNSKSKWLSIATVAAKELTFQIQPGACRVELPLPQELMAKVLVSPNLSAPVTFRFPDIEQPSDEFLIQITVDYVTLDGASGDDNERRRPGMARPRPRITYLFSNDGQILSRSSDQFEFNRGRPARGRGADVDYVTSKTPELTKLPAEFGLGRYTITSTTLYRRERSYGKQPHWESCGNVDLPAPQQTFEVHIDRKNEVTIQIPKDVLEKCTAATTATHTE